MHDKFKSEFVQCVGSIKDGSSLCVTVYSTQVQLYGTVEL